MRHNVYGRKLGRDKNERTALFRNLVQSLFLEEKIVTSEAKAKAIKGTVDRLITQAKSPTTIRFANQFVTQKKTQEKLVNELLPRLKGRTSGYTSMVKLGKRLGDDTSMVLMSLILEGERVKGEGVREKTVEKKSVEKNTELEIKKEAKVKGAKSVSSKAKGK